MKPPSKKSKSWYSNGLRFECQRCGKCCTNRDRYSFVYMTQADVEAMAKFLGLPQAQFRERHCEEEDGSTVLRNGGLPRCQFQADDGSCTVHPARPEQCRSWPFWRENLVRKTWEQEIAPFCPGVGEGELHSAEEIERIASHDEEWYERD
ncbi:MAG: YkgJ family cysteine cluster protein [Planctomycetes bacterium]|nr:YkgJ family cysteine cluster protein [Planctomycetota bacterium]